MSISALGSEAVGVISPSIDRDRHNMLQSAQDRLIVAIDVATEEEAWKLVSDVESRVSFFKVGYQFFVAAGMPFVLKLLEKGKRVFLDLKMDDVEETIALAVREIAKYPVSFLTVHGNGATARAAQAGRGDNTALKILSVTLLTSLDTTDLRDLGILGRDKKFKSLNAYVDWRADQALEAGCDGLITAGANVARLRKKHKDALIVTPGVRLPDTSTDDHKRPTTPQAAIAAGADYVVIGRPIRNTSNRLAMVDRVIEDIERGMSQR